MILALTQQHRRKIAAVLLYILFLQQALPCLAAESPAIIISSGGETTYFHPPFDVAAKGKGVTGYSPKTRRQYLGSVPSAALGPS